MLGLVAGGGRIDKPMLKAGRAYHKFRVRGTAGQRFEVSPRIQSSIHTEEETINILVNHQPSDETLLQVKRSVLLLPDEPVESEVLGSSTTRKKNKSKFISALRSVLKNILVLRSVLKNYTFLFDLRI